MKDWSFQFRYRCVRGLERTLPIGVFYGIIWLMAVVRTGFRLFRGLPPRLVLPQCLRVQTTARSVRAWRVHYYIRQTLAYFPERLASPKWLGRCEVSGLEELRRAKADKRPVVIAFTHFGPYALMAYWLRALGVPAATLIATKSGSRGPLRLMSDKNSLFPGEPTVLHRELRQVNDFVSQGNTLFVALDVAAGKLVDVPVGDGTYFRMAIGAARLALIHQAELFTCAITTVGPWRYRMVLTPVPGELLAGDADLARIGKAMFDQLLPQFQAHPGQCPKMLLEAFVQQPNVTPSVSRPDEPVAA